MKKSAFTMVALLGLGCGDAELSGVLDGKRENALSASPQRGMELPVLHGCSTDINDYLVAEKF